MSLTRYLVPLTTLMMYEQPDLTQRTAFNDPQMVLIRPENTVVMMKAEDVRAVLKILLQWSSMNPNCEWCNAIRDELLTRVQEIVHD